MVYDNAGIILEKFSNNLFWQFAVLKMQFESFVVRKYFALVPHIYQNQQHLLVGIVQ